MMEGYAIARDALNLIRQCKGPTDNVISPYDEGTVLKVIDELNRIASDAIAILTDANNDEVTDLDQRIEAKLTAMKTAIQRNKQCLIAYHHHRLNLIAGICSGDGSNAAKIDTAVTQIISNGSVGNNSMDESSVDPAFATAQRLLSRSEQKFSETMRDAFDAFQQNIYGGVVRINTQYTSSNKSDHTSLLDGPPKEGIILVRVLEDIGRIQTGDGSGQSINLRKDSLQMMRWGDAEPLIRSGLVKPIKK